MLGFKCCLKILFKFQRWQAEEAEFVRLYDDYLLSELIKLKAEESLRITQNRYEAAIANVTDLLRTETALLEARTRQLAAVHDQRIAAAMLELVSGTLTPDSAVLNERNPSR